MREAAAVPSLLLLRLLLLFLCAPISTCSAKIHSVNSVATNGTGGEEPSCRPTRTRPISRSQIKLGFNLPHIEVPPINLPSIHLPPTQLPPIKPQLPNVPSVVNIAKDAKQMGKQLVGSASAKAPMNSLHFLPAVACLFTFILLFRSY